MKIKFNYFHLCVDFDSKIPFSRFVSLFHITLHFRSVQQTDNHFSAPHNRRLLDEGTIQVNIKLVNSPRVSNNADKLSRLVSYQYNTAL